jgi:probable O-glycosylation ligase (exosortase A-associated)
MPLRDIALLLTVVYGTVMIFKHPAVGAYMWAWLSVMTPQSMTYGFMRGYPIAQYVALTTLVVFLFTRRKQALPLNAITILWLALFVWMSVTSFFALAPVDWVKDRWIFVFKIQLMLLVSLMLVCTARELKILVIVVTLSLAYFGIKGGIFTLRTGGGGRVWGPGTSQLGGNNELAVGLIMIVPYLYWMRQTLTHPRWGAWIRRGLTLAIILCAFSILGSHSRGALVGLLAIALFLGFKSAHPVRATLGIVTLVAVAVAFMPENWNERMDTIKTYQDDGSAMSRIWTWKTLTNAALDRPLVGAGFRADNRVVFDRYSPKEPQYAVFEGVVYVAHSIYFQMLGEHGFVGFGIWLAFWITVWRRAGKIGRQAEAIPELASWMPLLMRMTQVSLIGYAAGGAFLSLAYLDVAFYLAGYVLLSGMLLAKAQAAQALAPKPVTAGGAKRPNPVGVSARRSI